MLDSAWSRRPTGATSSARGSRPACRPGAASSTTSILPAEAGLDETHISFTKGCYPGQEPIARLHHRGHVNRRLRVLDVEAAAPGDEILHDGNAVGRVTSAVPGVALAYVRVEVPDDAELRSAESLHGYTDPPTRP